MTESEKDRIVRLKLRVIGVPCSTCLVPVKKTLEKTQGIKKVGANVMLDLILVDYDPGLVRPDQIIQAIKRVGYTAVPTATI